jgi:predicted nucleic acid-binding protein
MQLQLYDASTLIPLIRGEAYEAVFHRALKSGRARMSSVVMQELYAGASSKADKADLDAIRRAFLKRGYMVTPDHDDWVLAGILLARWQRLHGALNPRDHINDVLIVLDASKLGADLMTENSADMDRWRRMLPRARRGFRVHRLMRREHRMA